MGMELGASFLENLILLCSVVTACGTRHSRNRSFLEILLFSVLTSAVISLCNAVAVFSYITPLIAMLLTVLFSGFLSNGSLLQRSCACVLTCLVVLSFDYIILMFLSFSSGNTHDFFSIYTKIGSKERLLYLITTKLFDLLLYLVLYRKLSILQTLQKRMLAALFGLSSICFVAMQFLFHIVRSSNVVQLQFAIIFSWGFVLWAIVMVIAFFLSQAKYDRAKQTQNLLETQNRLMEENYRTTNARQLQSAKELHDFKHHLAVLRELNTEEKPQELAGYLDTLLQTSHKHTALAHTGNDMIDAILNCKAAEAEQLNIKFTFTTNLLTPVSISPTDLCGVLANQLDNAFEACAKIKDESKREVQVEIKQVQEMLFFKVRNTVAADPFRNNPQLKSTKENEANRHGFGLESIRLITEKYHGCLRAEFENGWFISFASLCERPLDT